MGAEKFSAQPYSQHLIKALISDFVKGKASWSGWKPPHIFEFIFLLAHKIPKVFLILESHH